VHASLCIIHLMFVVSTFSMIFFTSSFLVTFPAYRVMIIDAPYDPRTIATSTRGPARTLL
jgi:hypothetical protein